MQKRMSRFLAIVAIFAPALAAAVPTVSVGTCLPNYAHFLTISSAVGAIPPGGVIIICPGTYPEQVVISKPLTLRGQSINNADRPVIAVPVAASGPGLQVNSASALFGDSIAAQVLVQNVNPPGAVNLFNLTVDGTGGDLGCPNGNTDLVAIFFASGTSGSMQEVTARNQVESGCGFGLWAENANASDQSITITGSSIHNVDQFGILVAGYQNPSVLAATITNNFVSKSAGGILAASVSGTVSRNVISSVFRGIEDYEFPAFYQTPGITISYNAIADIGDPGGVAITLREGSTASFNKISNVSRGFLVNSGSAPNPGATLLANTIKNVVVAIEDYCSGNTVLKSNTVNDAQYAFSNFPSGFVIGGGVNPVYNVDTISTSGCP